MYDGALEEFNEPRIKKLEHEKTKKSKKRIMLKVERTKDVECRKEWSRKHGHDTVMMKIVAQLSSSPSYTLKKNPFN